MLIGVAILLMIVTVLLSVSVTPASRAGGTLPATQFRDSIQVQVDPVKLFQHPKLGSLDWIDVLPRFDSGLPIDSMGLVDFVLDCIRHQASVSHVLQLVVFVGHPQLWATDIAAVRRLQGLASFPATLTTPLVDGQLPPGTSWDDLVFEPTIDPKLPDEFALLTIAMHGEDFWMRKSLVNSRIRPLLILQEVNSMVDPRQFRTVRPCEDAPPIVMPRHKGHMLGAESPLDAFEAFGGATTYGASLAALDWTNNQDGYLLAHCDVKGEFCLWIRADVLSYAQRLKLQSAWLETKYKAPNWLGWGIRPEAIQWSFVADRPLVPPIQFRLNCGRSTTSEFRGPVIGLDVDTGSRCSHPAAVFDSRLQGCFIPHLGPMDSTPPRDVVHLFQKLHRPPKVRANDTDLPSAIYRSKVGILGSGPPADLTRYSAQPHSSSFSHPVYGHLPWYDALGAFERKVTSQNAEDGILEFIFQVIGTQHKQYVEIGVPDAHEWTTRHMRDRLGWHGVMFDARRADPRLNLTQATITSDNVESALSAAGVHAQVDLVVIDATADAGTSRGFRQAVKPRVLLQHVNTHLPPYDFWAAPSDASAPMSAGASLAAVDAVNRVNGYQLLYCEQTGTNCVWIRADLLSPEALADLSSRSLQQFFRPANFGRIGRRHDITDTPASVLRYDEQEAVCSHHPLLHEGHRRCWVDQRFMGWHVSPRIDEQYLLRSYRDARF